MNRPDTRVTVLIKAEIPLNLENDEVLLRTIKSGARFLEANHVVEGALLDCEPIDVRWDAGWTVTVRVETMPLPDEVDRWLASASRP